MIMVWGDLDTINSRIKALLTKIRETTYPGSSFFMTDSTRDYDLEIMEKEVFALETLNDIEDKFTEISDSIDSALLTSIPEITAKLLELFENFERTWTERQKKITEFTFV